MLRQHTITRLEGELQAEKIRVEKSAAAEEATKKHIETLAAQITERYVDPFTPRENLRESDFIIILAAQCEHYRILYETDVAFAQI